MSRNPITLKPVRTALALSLTGMLLSVNLMTAYSWSAPADNTPEIHFTTLASGQQVYVQEIHTQPIVTIDTWVNTGSAQENAANNGVSHFLEHLLFKGTDKYKVGEIDKTLESRGADFNAATSDDFTHFHITTASPYFKEALELHADMMMNATINPPELDRERKVVQEEINRALDNPARKAYIAMAKLIFPNHPYSMDTLGPKTNIQTIPRDTILGYYHKWYQPENFKTVVVGDINTNEAVDMVNQAFKKSYAVQTRPEPGSAKKNPVQPLTQPKAAVLADPNLSEVQWELGFLAPAITDRQENYALDIASMVLGQGASSRLYQHLKEDKQLVNGVSASNSTHQQAGIFFVDADIKPENREAAKKAIIDEIARFKEEGPTAEELAKAKTQVVKQFAFANESTEGVAESIGYNVTIGKLEDYTQYVNNIQKVTADQVANAARKYLDFNKAVMVEVVPGGNGTIVSDQAPQDVALLHESASSSSGTSLAASTDNTQAETTEAVSKMTLPNGATLLLKPSASTKTVALSIFAKGGRLAETKPGLAALTSRVLLKGTKNRTSKELTQQLEALGLSLAASSDEDYIQITGDSVSDDFDKLLFILQDVLANPTFPQDEIDKERADMLETLKTSRDQPSSLMFEKLTEALYPTHPYGAVGQRMEASLPGLTQRDLVSFYQQEIQPQNLVISVAGNFDPEEVKTSLQQILDQLPSSSKAPVSSFPDVKPLAQTVQVDAQKPEQAATWVAYGWLAPAISTSRDYITLKVINTMLGSGLSSRLFVDLREKQGLAYHVSSMFPSNLKNGNFVMYIGTDPKNLSKVQEGFDAEVKRLQTEPVSEDELNTVKSKLIGTFALAHESNANQAFYTGLYQTLGVGYQFDKEYPSFIQQVTPEDVQRVAQQIFSQPKVVTVVAPKTVRNETTVNEN